METCLYLLGNVAMPQMLYIYPSDLQLEAPPGWGGSQVAYVPQAREFVFSHGKTGQVELSLFLKTCHLPSDRQAFTPLAGQTAPYLGLWPSLGVARALEKR